MAANTVSEKIRLLQEYEKKLGRTIKLERWAYAAMYGREALRAAS
jgi:hypothetical protein